MAEEQGYWQQLSTRMGRRRALQTIGLGGAGVAATTLLACGRSETPSPASSTISEPQAKRGGIVTRAGGHESRTTPMDPHINNGVAAKAFGLFYQQLLGYDIRTYEVEAELAQKWEQASQNEYVFTLQQGVKWHNKAPANGRALTVEDVVYSFNRMQTNDPRFLVRSLLQAVDKVEAIDKERIRITTKTPDASLLAKLSGESADIVAPEVIERGSKFVTAAEAVGTGPFIITAREEGVSAEFVRNPEYWRAGKPYLDGVRTNLFADDQLAYAAFQANQIDILTLPGQEVKSYITKQGASFTPDWYKEDTLPTIYPQVKTKPMDDARVTRALMLLIDHEEFRSAWAEVWHGSPGRNGSVLPTALDSWDLSHEEYGKYIFWKQPKTDAVREALSLLSAAGYSASNPLRFEILCWSDNAFFAPANQLLQDQYKRLGQGIVDAQLRPVTIVQSYTVRANRQYSFFIGGNSASTTEPDSWLTECYRTGGSQNYMDYSDPKLDALIDRQRATFDMQQRKAVVKEAVVYAIENLPLVPPANRYFLNGIKPTIRGYSPEFSPTNRQFENIWLDT
jgi:peptide/nickel transport system substrate-binding protein